MQFKNRVRKARCNARAAFSLVEISIILLILSIALSTLIPASFQEQKFDSVNLTMTRLSAIADALAEFQEANDRLPCPASIGIGGTNAVNGTPVRLTDVEFGVEGNHTGASPGGCRDASSAPSSLVDYAINDSGVSREISVGSVPVRTLGLPDDYAFDGWGARFDYYVSLEAVDDSTDVTGEIVIHDVDANPVYKEATYAVVSHGENRHGAFLESGKRVNIGMTDYGQMRNAEEDLGDFQTNGHILVKDYKQGTGFESFDDIVIYGRTPSVKVPTIGVDTVHPQQSLGVGTHYACAIDASGQLYCWGTSNPHGRLGNGSAGSKYRPDKIEDGVILSSNKFVQLSLASNVACGLTDRGEVYCWGKGDVGQLGNGSTATPQPTPTKISSFESFAQVSVSNLHGCAITKTGKAYCWGDNAYGQLGNNNAPNDSSVPVEVAGGFRFKQIVAGDEYSCGLEADTGTAYCWGHDEFLQLGDGTATSVNMAAPNPSKPVAGGPYVQISGGGEHACGLVGKPGEVECWGKNNVKQLGMGGTSTTEQATPQTVANVTDFVQVSAGKFSTCGIDADGDAHCWGRHHGTYLNLGTGATVLTDYSTPTAVLKTNLADSNEKFLIIQAGTEYTACGLTNARNIYCWGRGQFGNLGDGNTTPVGLNGPNDSYMPVTDDDGETISW